MISTNVLQKSKAPLHFFCLQMLLTMEHDLSLILWLEEGQFYEQCEKSRSIMFIKIPHSQKLQFNETTNLLKANVEVNVEMQPSI